MPTFFRKIFNFFKSFFPKKISYSELIESGAQIIDVRTEVEYTRGSIKGSLNIPLDDLRNQFSKIDKEKPVITCCANGLRSGLAKSILSRNGYSRVLNGGSWNSLKRKLK